MNNENIPTAADGRHTTKGRPHGFSSLTPYIALTSAGEAIDFYCHVFGAVLIDRTDMPGPDGTDIMVHATLDLGEGRLQIGEVNPSFHLVPAPGGDDACYSLGLYVPDADAVIERALAAGATLREEVATFVSGDRFGSIRDPFGVRWSVMTRVEDLSEAESSRRVAEWAASMA